MLLNTTNIILATTNIILVGVSADVFLKRNRGFISDDASPVRATANMQLFRSSAYFN